MPNLFLRLVTPGALLFVYLAFTQVAHGIYFASESEAPPALTLIYTAGLLWIVGWWVLVDSRKRDIPWVYDIGFFLSVAWPFIMPYYLLKTRGAKGLLLIFAFVGTYITAFVVGAIGYLLFTQVIASS